MAVISDLNGAPVEHNILLDKWKNNKVFGEEKADKPDYCIFNNTAYALDLLNKHIISNSKIVFHTDVDVDGIGTTYIMKKMLENLGSSNHLLLINRDKIHGIQQKHVEYFKAQPIDLMIITDSSCNEIDVIKQFTCDVLVVDHHEMLHKDSLGYCNDGIHRYVIVNNTVDNSNFETDNKWLQSKNITAFNNLSEYKGIQEMSCGVVVYELMRVYCACYSNPLLPEALKLYQWAGITLFTDVIDTLNDRNQWYLDNTVFTHELEKNLSVILPSVNKFKANLDKSFIQYSFAPIINKAIRAGKGSEALNTVVNKPGEIDELNIYRELQNDAVMKATTIEVTDPNTGKVSRMEKSFNEPVISVDVGKYDINVNYTGVIASKLSGDNNKNAVVYRTIDNGKLKGSFRGRYKDIDYRKYFADYADDVYAQGHPSAFGFELLPEQLDNIISGIGTIEHDVDERPWLTVGNMNSSERGIYHIEDFQEFKRLGYIWKIATGNSKVISSDEVVIRVKANNVVLKSNRGKLFIYDVFGMECKAFKPLAGDFFDIYIEFTNEVNIYIR